MVSTVGAPYIVRGFTLKDVEGHVVDPRAHLSTRGGSWTLRAVGSLLLFLVARPLVRRLNLGR